MNGLFLKIMAGIVVGALIIALGISLKTIGRRNAELLQANRDIAAANRSINERDAKIAAFSSAVAGQAEEAAIQCAQQGDVGFARGVEVGRAICAAK
jgi:hypothetical protein